MSDLFPHPNDVIHGGWTVKRTQKSFLDHLDHLLHPPNGTALLHGRWASPRTEWAHLTLSLTVSSYPPQRRRGQIPKDSVVPNVRYLVTTRRD